MAQWWSLTAETRSCVYMKKGSWVGRRVKGEPFDYDFQHKPNCSNMFGWPRSGYVWDSRSGAVASKGSCSTAANNAPGCALFVASCVMILQIERSIRHLFVMNGWSIQITAGVPSRAPATCLCYPLCLGSFCELLLSYLCAVKLIQKGDEVKRKICNEDMMRIMELTGN